MSKVHRKDTRPELLVRSRLWRMGFRYRIDYAGLPGRPDITFGREKIAVFIDGDFWHGNAWKLRGFSSLDQLFPTNTEWWVSKINRNIQRDQDVNEALTKLGWRVLRYWESAVLADVETVVRSIVRQVGEPQQRSKRRKSALT